MEAKGSNADDMLKLSDSEMHELHGIYEQEMEARTKRLSDVANELMIHVPSWWEPKERDKWEEGRFVRRYLTREAMNELRAAIRAERKARWELIVMWAPVIGMLTGLVGATTGLIAVLSKSAGH